MRFAPFFSTYVHSHDQTCRAGAGRRGPSSYHGGCGWGATLSGLVATILLCWSATGALAQQIDLRPQLAEGVRTVTVEWQLAGELRLPAPTDGLRPAPTPKVGATGRLTYDETPLPTAAPPSASEVPARFVRLYREVETSIGVDSNVRQQTVRPERHLTLTSSTTTGPQILAIDGPLRREELDTLRLPADSLSLAGLLPNEPLEIGATWHHTPETIASLTMLQTVEICECQSVLAEANSRYAKCQMGGTIHGTIDGTRTEMDLDAVYLVDLERGEITQFNLAIREHREVGPITPGLEGIVKLRVAIAPTDREHLTPELVDRVVTSYPVPATAVETWNSELGFLTTHDASWHTTGSRGRSMSLRKISPAGLVAHATLTRLPPKELVPEVSLAEFRADVARAIGEPMAGIASDESFTNQHGCRVLYVVAQGAVDGVPVEWHAYQVAPPAEQPDGHRLALTFVIESDRLEELAGQDRQLVERIELLPEPAETAASKRQPLK